MIDIVKLATTPVGDNVYTEEFGTIHCEPTSKTSLEKPCKGCAFYDYKTSNCKNIDILKKTCMGRHRLDHRTIKWIRHE